MKRVSWLERVFGPGHRPPAKENTRLPDPSPAFRPAGTHDENDSLSFGTVARSDQPITCPFDELTGAHYLCGATTGQGKSRLVAGIVQQYYRRLACHGEPGVVVVDPKSETVDLILRLIAQDLPTMSRSQQERLLDSLVVIAPCRRRSPITPLQLLKTTKHDAEARAAEVGEALTMGIESDMGVLQEILLGNVLALLIEAKEDWSLVEVPQLLSDEQRLRKLAQCSQLAGPRAYILSGRFGREGTARIAGIQGRLEKLLRIERLRLALGAPDLIDLGRAFRGGITLIDLGSDYSSDEPNRIVGRLLFSRLTSYLFSSSPDSLKPTLLVCEEFPDLLGKGLGARAEKIFSQARSRKTGCMVLFQAPAQLQREGLLRVLQANTRFTILGQVPVGEAKYFEELLPQTGQVPRGLLPGEVLPKSPYLSLAEERKYRLEELGKLPLRTFLFSDRRRRDQTTLLKAAHCDPPSWQELSRLLAPELLERVRSGSVSITEASARQHYEQRMERLISPVKLSSPIRAPRPDLPVVSRRKRGRGIP